MSIKVGITLIISILLLCTTTASAAQGRKLLHTTNEFSAYSPITNDGICKTLVETQGYKCEEHTVTTNDGYILNLQRIPTGRSGKKADKPPVLLQHGLFCNAIVWLFNSPEESLGFILADNGFDVWLANGRGTKYSTGHTSLTPNDMAYWDWSWDELASYDLPASVEYVFNHTGQKLHYAGHSQGTLVAFVALSQGKLLNMLRSTALLSPIAHLNMISSELTKVIAELFLANDVYWLGVREIDPNANGVTKFVDGICFISNLNCGDVVTLLTAAAEGRKSLYTANEFSARSPVNGICKTLVETQGYKCEEHTVTTNDGYILSLLRIPTGRSGKKADKPPVLIQHGLFCDAAIWLFDSPEQSLGFILADSGFDVWLVNGRGTKYSTGHTSLTTYDKAYWDWSWEELANYDLPASVEYVFDLTGQKIHYAGHSQGTLVAFVNLSQGKLLNMLRSAALLSPIAHMNQLASPATKLAAQFFLANDVYWLGLREFIPQANNVAKFVGGICSTLNQPCINLITFFTGPNCCLNSSRIDVYVDHEPQPTATKNLIHLSQMIRTGKISKYDYGILNILHYGQLVPPSYDMTKIPKEFPLFISYGGKDYLSDVKDVKVLLNDLSNHDADKLVVLYKDEYAHVDFIMAIDAKQVLYDPMIAFYDSN